MMRDGGRARRLALGVTFAFTIAGMGSAIPAVLTGCQPERESALELGGVERVEQELHGDDTCIQDMWRHAGNSQNLTCSANDVRVARATNICVDDGMGGCKAESTCTEGLPVTFTADFEVVLTAKERFDIGVYFATDGGGADGAITGQCAQNLITPSNAPMTFVNNDASPDTCGDIDDEHNPQIMQLTVTTLCISNEDPEDPKLLLPNCTSWRQPGSNEVCNDVTDAYPGSPSKCNCDDEFAIDITVENLDATVTKTVRDACVTYDVLVDNTTSTRDMTLNSLSDAPYGDITDPNNPNLCSTTCGQPAGDGGTGGAGELPVLLEVGESYACEFSARVLAPGSDDPITDVVTATMEGEDETETLSATGQETVIIDLDVADPSADAGVP